jgi:hypothetical protein
MIYDVAKPFKTVNRKFAPGPGPGGSVSDDDDVSPLTIKQLKARNFIKPRADDPVQPAAEPSPAISKPGKGAGEK